MAGAKQGMVPGFNHNVKHRGKVFHVQTEDSGATNPQIVTHLFAGGNILASKRIFYGDIAEAENLAVIVRELMEEQHKDVLRCLVHGVYDDEALAPEGKVYQPGELAPASPSSQPAAPTSAPAAAPASALASAPAAPLASAPAAASPSSLAASPASAPAAIPASPPAVASAPPRTAQLPPPLPRNRAAAARPTAAPPSPPRLPVGVGLPSGATAVSPSAPATTSPAPASPVTAAAAPLARRGEHAETLFGEDPISEKSLDEVILSYLAGDRDAKK